MVVTGTATTPLTFAAPAAGTRGRGVLEDIVNVTVVDTTIEASVL